MANLTTKTFSTLVSDFVAAVQSASSVLVDFATGSILRAISEGMASVVIWLESLILLLLQTTRAATSSGTDLDTWMADYSLTRLPAKAATGNVTFARFTPTLQALVPVGTVIQSADGTQQYAVVADTTNAAYSASQDGYVIEAGVSSVAAAVQAVNTGAATNAAVNTITVITQAIPSVDTVTNALAFTNGEDAETDTALRARFVAYIANLSKATKDAIGYAITSLQTGVSYSLVENYAYNGTYTPGYFYVVVDDGSGDPPSTFLDSVSNAVDAVRGFTASFGVFAPVVVNATVAMSATIASGYDPTATKALAQTAIDDYIDSLTLGQTLPYTRLAQIAYDASPGITNITGVTLNGGTSDLTADAKHVIKSLSVTVS